MFKLAVLVLAIAVLGGAYLTKPEEPAMRDAANAVLNDPQTLSEGLQGIGASISGERVFKNFYVASQYSIVLDSKPVVECWGGFTQVKCTRIKHASETAPASN
jgi:hypothetical protein